MLLLKGKKERKNKMLLRKYFLKHFKYQKQRKKWRDLVTIQTCTLFPHEKTQPQLQEMQLLFLGQALHKTDIHHNLPFLFICL